MGVEKRYYPMFIPRDFLEKEKDHIEGFNPEVAWVTRVGDSDLPVPLALRPTSEAVIYPNFRVEIRSHRDLPLKINQWANAVRWEIKDPTPFIRSREFLWQEGHTAFATKKEADEESCLYEEFLAVPVIKGFKSENEKFAGALYTTSIEIIKERNQLYGRTRGDSVPDRCWIRVDVDNRDNYSCGWKYSDQELKGAPLRIEIGPRDLAKNQVRIVRLDTGAKMDIKREYLIEKIKDLLENIQRNLYDVAKRKVEESTQKVETWDDFVEALSQKKLILAPWCDEVEVEKDVKERTRGDGTLGGAKTLCTLLEQPELREDTLCFASRKPAKKWTYWGRSY
ncbi:unnamed protein product [Arabis nemorensis]|uniref:proline--tRNA ligase n=1 Tax=Arabis nemorensis TaxID=586526 RepID=A0A565BUT3_9BRAS|nr:unnamed protein product [Arabis nemorensis]